MKLLWVVPETEGGIASYSRSLWPAVQEAASARGWACAPPALISGAASGGGVPAELLELVTRERPDLIHVQHEYGLFGGKFPLKYSWPKWVKTLRAAAPEGARLVATAHTVLPQGYRYPVTGRAGDALARRISNLTWVPWAQKLWTRGTWGLLDGAITHSRLQSGTLVDSGCREVEVIPHFVPAPPPAGRVLREAPRPLAQVPEAVPVLGVFGYLTPEKGQDVAIEALARWGASGGPGGERPFLLLGGGVRRREDKAYELACQERIRDLGLSSRVKVTGFLSTEGVTLFFKQTGLVLAPFRETSGSGSLATAFAQGAAVLASDLPLNREIAEREPGALAFFRSEDAADLAQKAARLLSDPSALKALAEAGARYAAACSPVRTAAAHVEFYERVMRSGGRG